MKVYIQTERGYMTTGTESRLVFGVIMSGTAPARARRRKAYAGAVVTVAVAVAYYLLVLTDIGPIQ